MMANGAVETSAPKAREEETMSSHDALQTILPVAGLDPERARNVEITGGSDPILPTSF